MSRSYGSGLACRTAMRSSGVPARTASTTARTASRTSSSRVGGGEEPGPFDRRDRGRGRRRAASTVHTEVEPIRRHRHLGVGPVVSGERGDDRRRRSSPPIRQSRVGGVAGHALGEVDDDRTDGVAHGLLAADRRARRPPRSSGLPRRTSRLEARASRAVQPDDVGGPLPSSWPSASSAAGDRSRSSRYAATSAASVAKWAATGAKSPGASSSDARTAAVSTGVEIGRAAAAGQAPPRPAVRPAGRR